jgi:hypothetical protein
MSFVNISLARGKPPEYLEAVSQAVHGALVAELNMKPGDHPVRKENTANLTQVPGVLDALRHRTG